MDEIFTSLFIKFDAYLFSWMIYLVVCSKTRRKLKTFGRLRHQLKGNGTKHISERSGE